MHIQINKLRVDMILSATKLLQAHLKIKKRYVMVVFACINAENFLYSTYECACAAHDTTISQMKYIVETSNTDIK